MEIWKDVKGFEGLYQISNKGRVKSLSKSWVANNNVISKLDTIRKTTINPSGYITTVLHNKGKKKTVFIHKLIAEAFIDNPNSYNEVNHIDHDKLNNSIDNLEWCTRSYNMKAMIDFYDKRREDKYCNCGNKISQEAENCLTCLGIINRKVKERPNKEELLKLVIELPFTKIGELYEVSDNAIRKWCKDYNIPHRKKDLIKLKSIG